MKELAKVKTVPDFLKDSPFSHAPGVFSREPSYALRTLVSALSQKIIVEKYVAQRIRELAGRGPVVYALKYRSYFDVQYIRLRFAQLGLPAPCFVFDGGGGALQTLKKRFFSSQLRGAGASHSSRGGVHEQVELVRGILQAGGAVVFFLVDEKTTKARYVHPETDPINILVEVQSRMAASIAVIPMMILYERGQRRTVRPFWEELLGDPDHPGIIKRVLTAVRRWTVPELLMGNPVYLVAEFEEFGADHELERLAFDVRNELINSINERVRVNRGPERMSRTEIKERVLQDPKVQTAIEHAVAHNAMLESELRKKAESFVEEIAGDQRIQVHHFLFLLLRWLFGKIFTEIDVQESQFEILKRTNEAGSLIYVSCHKSHLDYLLIGYLSFCNQMAIPYMAAGKNLSFWPVGPILRNAGAFFIRRSFQKLGAFTRLYTRVFEAYLRVLLSEKININFYIEGGRSRTGKLLPPRIGMLSFLLQAVDEGYVDDLAFVPSFVAYDQVPEESSYLRELAGAEKEKESFWSFMRSREALKRKYGKAYIRFHSPVSYKEFLKSYLPGGDPKPLDSIATRKMYQDFAYFLMSGIAKAGVVTPIELTAASLLSPGEVIVSPADIVEHAQALYETLQGQGTELAASFKDLSTAVESSLMIFTQRGLIEPLADSDDGDGKTYHIRASKRMTLDYYRNALLNFVWADSLAALSVLAVPHDQTEAASRHDKVLALFTFLKEVLVKELIWDPLVPDDALLDACLTFFVEKEWLKSDLTPAQPTRFQTVGSLARDLLHVYYLSLLAARTLGDGGVGQKEFARIIAEVGVKRKGGRENMADPVVTMISVDNALSSFSEMGIFQYRPGKKYLEKIANQAKWESAEQKLWAALRPWYGSEPDQRSSEASRDAGSPRS
ncbi:MAG: 1-acyl-sn-glycerol-3-phosphate acyltransferase [Desulfomonilaceae bacterium]